mmetsp:Transcript_12178/g.36722  ORF Transcript_12178/g.36722 Transcript_12178/m.36722 type:complete len:219 (+) Transcript_12178:435-1091(+)
MRSGVGASPSPTTSTSKWSSLRAISATLETSSGKVADKSKPCRSSGGGNSSSSLPNLVRMGSLDLNMGVFQGPLPMSWSASSSTRTCMRCSRSQNSGSSSMCSCRRPGVETRTSQGCEVRARRSLRMSDPPKTLCTPRPWGASRVRASSAICRASSRVGVTTTAPMPPPTFDSRYLSFSAMGIRKASVFPVPVLALMMASAPPRISGSACACTSVMAS